MASRFVSLLPRIVAVITDLLYVLILADTLIGALTRDVTGQGQASVYTVYLNLALYNFCRHLNYLLLSTGALSDLSEIFLIVSTLAALVFTAISNLLA